MVSPQISKCCLFRINNCQSILTYVVLCGDRPIPTWFFYSPSNSIIRSREPSREHVVLRHGGEGRRAGGLLRRPPMRKRHLKRVQVSWLLGLAPTQRCWMTLSFNVFTLIFEKRRFRYVSLRSRQVYVVPHCVFCDFLQKCTSVRQIGSFVLLRRAPAPSSSLPTQVWHHSDKVFQDAQWFVARNFYLFFVKWHFITF